MNRQTSRHRWLISTAAAAAAAALIVIGAIVLAARNDATESQSPAARSTTTAPATVAAAAEEIARGFLDAYGAFDADRAMTYLTDDALDAWQNPEGFRLEISHMEAIGYQQMINNCEHRGGSASGIRLRCAFDLHAIRSNEIGLGPYTDNYWDLTVGDGKIVSAVSTWAFMTNGFSQELWEPFAAWVSTEYPDDVAVMYTDATHSMQRLSAESIRLWDQHTREYAAAYTPTGG